MQCKLSSWNSYYNIFLKFPIEIGGFNQDPIFSSGLNQSFYVLPSLSCFLFHPPLPSLPSPALPSLSFPNSMLEATEKKLSASPLAKQCILNAPQGFLLNSASDLATVGLQMCHGMVKINTLKVLVSKVYFCIAVKVLF